MFVARNQLNQYIFTHKTFLLFLSFVCKNYFKKVPKEGPLDGEGVELEFPK